MIQPDDVIVCNCCECSVELLADSMFPVLEAGQLPAAFEDMEFVAGRIAGRPYCRLCIKPRSRPGRGRANQVGQGASERITAASIAYHGGRGGTRDDVG